MAASQFRNALHLFPAPESGWIPKVLTYSGFYNIGVKEIWDMVYEYIDFVKKNGYFDYRRNEQSKYWMYETINEQLRDSFYHNPRIEDVYKRQAYTYYLSKIGEMLPTASMDTKAIAAIILDKACLLYTSRCV